MFKQGVMRLFKFALAERLVVVPVSCQCFYDDEHGFVVLPPKVSLSEARMDPYLGEVFPVGLLPVVKEEAIELARLYNWQLAYEQDTKPV